MIQKQTVYLPVKDKMPFFTVLEDFEYKTGAEEAKGYFFTPEQLNEYIQSIIKQTLENAAEKAKIRFVDKTLSRTEISVESITNTFEETYNKLKV